MSSPTSPVFNKNHGAEVLDPNVLTKKAEGTALSTFLLRPFILPFLMLLLVAGSMWLGIDKIAQSRTSASDSQNRLVLIGWLSSDIASMENQFRSYLITGNAKFKENYQLGTLSFGSHQVAMLDLSFDSNQRDSINQINKLVLDWQANIAEPQMALNNVLSSSNSVLIKKSILGSDRLELAQNLVNTLQFNENERLKQINSNNLTVFNQIRLVTLSSLFIVLAWLLLTFWKVAQTVTGVITILINSAREIAHGQYHLRIPQTSIRELSALGDQFDVMATAIQDREQALQITNSQLERSNRELEQFAYIASHDLQEPLRTIGSYTELLARRYQGQLDDRADQYIAFTVAATRRMKNLIQDLLVFSRVRQGQRTFTTIDIKQIAEDVVADLASQLEEVKGEVKIFDLPDVLANENLMRHVFQNLIGNGLKFHDPKRPPVVKVSATREDKTWVFHVQDNGIGIEPQYHEKIFGVFQRLHNMEKYSGSGIGLSLARTAVEQQGGKLWLSSTPDQGSTFHFSLPDQGTPSHPAFSHPALAEKS